MARRHAVFLAIGLMVLIVLAGAFGCDGTLQQLVTSASTSRPAAEADPNDPDKRRASIVEWSGKSWGLKEPYTAYYAASLRKDNDALVRSAAAGALGQTHDAKYVGNLAAALEDASPQVRWDVAQALDDLPGKAAIGPLQKHATEDESADVRASCARALRHYGSNEVGKTLLMCLADDDFAVRHQAHATLVELSSGRDVGFNARDWEKALENESSPKASTRPWWQWSK
ncbi:MAG: HEAT repeat domain-containing protein [Phycisphaerae bacterium]